MIVKIILSGERAPVFWGRAYYRFETDEPVITPIPLNWLIGWWHKGLLNVRSGARDTVYENLAIAYNQGFQQGWDEAQKFFYHDSNEVILNDHS